jgi:hypothetical protein
VADAPATPVAAVRDSAGITIIESPAALEDRPFALQPAAAPAADIGAVEGPAEYQLFRVSGVALLPADRLVVANGGSQELRFFDTGGRFLNRAGRRGDGPGEYQFPMLVPSPFRDSLLVYDAFARRFSVLTADGAFVRTVTPTQRIGEPVGILADGRIVTSQNSARGGPDTPEGVMPNRIAVAIADLPSASADTIGFFEGPDLFFASQDGRISFTAVPFDVGPSVAAGADRIFVTPGRVPEIREFDANGTLVRIFRVLRDPVPVTRQQFDAFVEARVAQASDDNAAAELRRRYANMPLRDALPAYQRLLVDAEGNVWAERYRPDDAAPPAWAVFGPDGAALGTVTLPAAARIQTVANGLLIATRRDEMDVEHVVVWRLVPPGG